MSVSFARGSAAALFLVFSSQSAFADLTADEVWADWKAYLSSTGYSVTATEDRSGATLTLSGLTMEMPLPEEDGSLTMTMGDLSFSENGDGTVSVQLPANMPVNAIVTGDDVDGTLKIQVLVSHDGSPMMVSGDASEMTYDYATQSLGINLDRVSMDGEEMPAGVLDAKVEFANLNSKSIMRTGTTRGYDQSMSADSLSYQAQFADPEGSDNGQLNGSLQGMTYEGTSTIPEDFDASNAASLFTSALGGSARFAYTGGQSSASGSGDGESFGFESSSQGGSFDVALKDGGFSYALLQNQTNISVTSSDLPFPLSLSMAEAGFNLAFPLAQSADEQDFAMGVTLRDFAVPDMLWGMVDPTGVLPRDPASIVLDMAGKAKVLVNIFDEDELEKVEDGEVMPGELNALTIRELLVSAAGTELTGTGDFTFNNADLATYDGLPAPAGAINLTLKGANGLIDGLIKMGLLAEQDAMGARMMMGMFGVPGDGEDTLNSEIKFTEDGQILANGQRIK